MPVPDADRREAYKPMSARIDWAYHTRLPAAWGWFVLAVVVLVACVALVVASASGPLPLDRLASPGPVARAHQAWENDCATCHVPFTPIGSADGSRKCTDCHDGPAHHPNEVGAPACAECHVEHQGRDGPLTRPTDAACTRCHSDLKAHRNPEPQLADLVSSIRGFADAGDGHPEFRPLRDQTRLRGLKFSHAAHLSPGMGAGFTYAHVSERDRDRYLALTGARRADAPVALGCAACHAADAGRTDAAFREPAAPKTPAERFAAAFDAPALGLPHGALRPPRGDGRNHLPVVYEAHCRACHPLGFDAALPGVEVPHRLPPAGVAEFLRRTYADRWVTGGLPGSPAGGAANDRLDPRESAVPAPPATVGAAIAARVAAAQLMLFDGDRACRKCHTAEFPAGGGRIPTRILPGDVPVVWLPAATFSHAAHRNEACDRCHVAGRTKDEERRAAEKAAPARAADPHFQHRPDVPGIGTCRACHGPSGGAVRGCTDCHPYHAIDRPLQGVGARTPHRPAAR